MEQSNSSPRYHNFQNLIMCYVSSNTSQSSSQSFYFFNFYSSLFSYIK